MFFKNSCFIYLINFIYIYGLCFRPQHLVNVRRRIVIECGSLRSATEGVQENIEEEATTHAEAQAADMMTLT